MVDYSVNIQINGQQAEQAARRLAGALDNVDRSSSRVQHGLNTIVDGALRRVGELGVQAFQRLGQAVVGFGVQSVQVFTSFERGMDQVKALTGATAQEFDLLEKQARSLGATTRFSAKEASEAMAFLGMAGFETNEILAATPELLDLAAAGVLDLGKAADITSNIMGQFGINAEDVDRVTNLLAATAASANTNVEQLAEAFTYLGPTAQAVGISIEETAAIVGVLGDAGIQGSLAGRALGTSLVRLADPTDKMVAAMEELNVQAFDAQGNFVGMAEFLEQLERGTADYTKEQTAANLSALLGAESFQEINILLERGSEAYREYTESITGTNKASEIAAIQSDNLEGSLKRLQSATQEAQISIGEALEPALRAAAEKTAEFVTELFTGEAATKGMAGGAEQLAESIKEIDASQLIKDLRAVWAIASDVLEVLTGVSNTIRFLSGGKILDFVGGGILDSYRGRISNSASTSTSSSGFDIGAFTDRARAIAGLGQESVLASPLPTPSTERSPLSSAAVSSIASEAATAATKEATKVVVPITVESLNQLAKEKFGLRLDNPNVSDPNNVQVRGGRHAPGSLHYAGRALDFGNAKNTPQQLGAFFDYLMNNHASQLQELFYDPKGVMIRRGQVQQGSIGGHSNHLHVGFKPGAAFEFDSSGATSADRAAIQFAGEQQRAAEQAAQEAQREAERLAAEAERERLDSLRRQREQQQEFLSAMESQLSNNESIQAEQQGNLASITDVSSITESTQALEDQIYTLQERNRLLTEGFTEKEIDNQVKMLELERDVSRAFQEQAQAIHNAWLPAGTDKAAIIQELSSAYDEYLKQTRDLVAAEEAHGMALEQANQAAQQAIESQRQLEAIAQQLTGEFTNFAVSVISGAESIDQAIGQLFKNLLGYLANAAFQSLFSGLFGDLLGVGGGGGIPGFASGGIVTRPTLAMVGEGGSNEAVVPLPDGRSIPVQMQGGGSGAVNVTVNVNNPSSGEDGRRLGKQISEIVKAELVNQKRSGGILR